MVVPTFLATSSILTMDVFDQLFWALAAYVMILILQNATPTRWVLFGLIVALGLLTKMTMLFWGFGLFIGLILTPHRTKLLGRWPWLAGVIAFAGLLPYLIWQVRNGWPTLEFWQGYGDLVYPASPLEFLFQQVLAMHPLTLPIWLAGLYYYLLSSAGRPYRPLGWAYVVLYVLFMFSQRKFYFLAPAYPMLFAAGAIVIEQLARRRHWPWLRPAALVALSLGGAVMAPLAIPVLPVETLVQITAPLGGDAGLKSENHRSADLPQHFADRFGWEEMTATVAAVYESLPPEEQAQACILAENYGEAGALEFLGQAHHLPRVISGHMTYFLWGPGACTGDVLITIGFSQDDLAPVFGEIEQRALFTCQHCMPYESDLPIYVVRHPIAPAADLWPQAKDHDN
jgi:hypothetical protein